MVKKSDELTMRLRIFARLRGFSNDELGEHLGVTGVSVSRYFSGAREPRRKVSDRMKALTGGVIHSGNYADEIGPEEAARMMAEIEQRLAAASGAAHG